MAMPATLYLYVCVAAGWDSCVACAATAVARLGVRCPCGHSSGWVCVARAATAVAGCALPVRPRQWLGWVCVARAATAVAGCALHVRPRRWLGWVCVACAATVVAGLVLPVWPRRWLGVHRLCSHGGGWVLGVRCPCGHGGGWACASHRTRCVGTGATTWIRTDGLNGSGRVAVVRHHGWIRLFVVV